MLHKAVRRDLCGIAFAVTPASCFAYYDYMKGENFLHMKQINCGKPLYGGMTHGNFL